MTRLLDLGIDRIRNIIMDMAKLSEHSVLTAIESYEKGASTKKTIFEWSEQLRVLQDEVSDLAIELIARYQPVATDLRFIRSCMEISYGFSTVWQVCVRHRRRAGDYGLHLGLRQKRGFRSRYHGA